MTVFSAYRDNLLDRPSMVDGGRCVVCGRPATNRHHVIPKGMGGVPKALERRIPKLLLCGGGNASGCHGMAHAHTLHLNWSDAMGWCFLVTDEPMDDELAWRTRARDFRPLKGQKLEGITYGKRA